jgi:hypothetical protein
MAEAQVMWAALMVFTVFIIGTGYFYGVYHEEQPLPSHEGENIVELVNQGQKITLAIIFIVGCAIVIVGAMRSVAKT